MGDSHLAQLDAAQAAQGLTANPPDVPSVTRICHTVLLGAGLDATCILRVTCIIAAGTYLLCAKCLIWNNEVNPHKNFMKLVLLHVTDPEPRHREIEQFVQEQDPGLKPKPFAYRAQPRSQTGGFLSF